MFALLSHSKRSHGNKSDHSGPLRLEIQIGFRSDFCQFIGCCPGYEPWLCTLQPAVRQLAALFIFPFTGTETAPDTRKISVCGHPSVFLHFYSATFPPGFSLVHEERQQTSSLRNDNCHQLPVLYCSVFLWEIKHIDSFLKAQRFFCCLATRTP